MDSKKTPRGDEPEGSDEKALEPDTRRPAYRDTETRQADTETKSGSPDGNTDGWTGPEPGTRPSPYQQEPAQGQTAEDGTAKDADAADAAREADANRPRARARQSEPGNVKPVGTDDLTGKATVETNPPPKPAQ